MRQVVGRVPHRPRSVASIQFQSRSFFVRGFNMKYAMNVGGRLACLLLVISAAAWPIGRAEAQGVTTGALTGVITDDQMRAVPGASVVAIHAPSGTVYEASS